MNLKESPAAYADIQGKKNYPNLKGKVYFYDTYGGTMAAVTVRGITDGNGKKQSELPWISYSCRKRVYGQCGRAIYECGWTL